MVDYDNMGPSPQLLVSQFFISSVSYHMTKLCGMSILQDLQRAYFPIAQG